MPDTFQCPVCDGTSGEPVLTLHDRIMGTTDATFCLMRCSNCGLLRLHPTPDDLTLAQAYGANYAPHVRSGVSGRAKTILERRSVRLLWQYLASPRRVLDVGCATGDLLAAIRAAGNSNVTGVEPGEEAAAAARRRGVHVVSGDLLSAGFPAEAFDTVLLSHTIEHVSDPATLLTEINRVLAPDGVLIIWMPNADSLEATLFGRFWIGYDAPRHLTTFSTGTLGLALRRSGFVIEDISHEAVGLEWAWGIRLIVRERVPAVDHLLSRLHPLLIVLFTPFALLGSMLRRSGRVRVISRKLR